MLEGMRPPSKKTACGVSKGAELLSKEDYKVLVEALDSAVEPLPYNLCQE